MPKKSIEVAVAPRKGSGAVSLALDICRHPVTTSAPRGALSSFPLWGFLVYPLYTMQRVNCRCFGIVAVEEVPWGDGKRTLTKAYMLFF